MKGKKGKGEAGGRQPNDGAGKEAGGNPYVFAEEKERKRGGKVKKHLGGMHGAKAKHRLDKPGRKMGGRVGADRSPLSSAHKKSSGHEPD